MYFAQIKCFYFCSLFKVTSYVLTEGKILFLLLSVSKFMELANFYPGRKMPFLSLSASPIPEV